MTYDTFDTDAVATSGVTFSNGNLTALAGTGASLFSAMIAQAVEGKTAGKWYVEFTCNVLGGTDSIGILNSWGIGAGSLGYAYETSAPSNDNGWGYFNVGAVYHSQSSQTSVNATSWLANDVIGVAIDLDNGKVWFRKNTGSWCGTGGTPDPATDTGGFDISHMLTNGCRVYPAVGMDGATSKYTANFGATSFTGSVPSGFSSGWTNTTAGTYFGTFATTGLTGQYTPAPPQNDKSVVKYACTISGSLTSVIFPFSGSTVSDLKAVIYDHTGSGGLPGALLGISSNTITSGNYGEQTFNFSGVTLSNGSNYWIGLVSDSVSSTSNNVMLTSGTVGGATTLLAYNSGTYASPTNPFGASPSTNVYRYPMIANVSAATNIAHSQAGMIFG